MYYICTALNFKKYFDFSYSAASPISGMSQSSTAFVGCVSENVSSTRLLTFLLFCYTGCIKRMSRIQNRF